VADYRPPLRDIRFVLEHLTDLGALCELPEYSGLDPDTIMGVLEENAKFVAEVIAPLNRVGDLEGSQHDPSTNTVRTPAGFIDGYKRYVDAGWPGVPFPEVYDGGGFPWLVGITMQEFISSANMAFSMAPLLTQGAIDLLMHHGSEEQKERWLPGMASGELIGCFGLTEADAGSDPAAMRTRARRDGDDWVINGSKLWITNGSVADVAVIWAQTDDGIRGFLVEKETPGFSAIDIHGKLSLRASVTSELVLDDVRVPAASQLPEASSLGAPLSCLNEARFGIIFGAAGAARACFEEALSYSGEREVFDKPLSGFQLTQQKLVEMALEVNKASLLALHLGRMKDEGTLAPEHVSFGKLSNTVAAIGVARTARTILGANGVSLEYPVMRHANNLESVLTYEGTAEIHTLVVGAALTGQQAYR